MGGPGEEIKPLIFLKKMIRIIIANQNSQIK